MKLDLRREDSFDELYTNRITPMYYIRLLQDVTASHIMEFTVPAIWNIPYILILTILTLIASKSKAEAWAKVSNSVEVIQDDSTMNYFVDIEKNKAWFVGCDSSLGRIEAFAHVANCHLRVRTYSFDHSIDSTEKNCSFQMKAPTEGSLMGFMDLKALRFDTEKFLVYWLATDHKIGPLNETIGLEIFIKFIAIDMNTCRNYEFQTEGSPLIEEESPLSRYASRSKRNFYHEIFMRENRIDVFYKNLRNSEIVQESFNSTGQRIYGPVLRDQFQIDDESELVVDYDSDRRLWSLESRERFKVGDVCDGMRIPCETRLKTDWDHLFSRSKNAVTSCDRSDSGTWNCTDRSQYSFANFFIEFDHNPHHIMIYNGVWNEKLLAVTSKDLTNFYLTMFDFNANSYKPVLFTSLSQMALVPKGYFYLDNDYNICFHMAWIQDVHFNSVIKCDSKELFTKKREILEKSRN